MQEFPYEMSVVHTYPSYSEKSLILLLYTGSPATPAVGDVSAFLSEFLMDRHVITLPQPLRWLLVHGIIVPARRKAAAHRYQQVFQATHHTMPLVHYAQNLAQSLEAATNQWVVALPRMGNNEDSQVSHLLSEHTGGATPRSIILLPLFPQYTYSSVASLLDFFRPMVQALYPQSTIQIIPPYYNHPAYIQALQKSLGPTEPETRYLFSFHSVPLSHRRRDREYGFPPYKMQCLDTARLLADKMQIAPNKRLVAFQSKMGKGAWEKPYTEQLALQIASKGEESPIKIIAPGFLCDCLETIVDLQQTLIRKMNDLGQRQVSYHSALNDSSLTVDLLSQLLQPMLTHCMPPPSWYK